ncbi:MAG: DNA-binding protein [Xenococcaceae cyanobacterium]
MPDSRSTSEPMVLHPQDFDPPLKRKEPLIPGYWTIDELAAELECSIRKIQYDITGNPQRGTPAKLKAYKAGPTFLVADLDALPYIKQYRKN